MSQLCIPQDPLCLNYSTPTLFIIISSCWLQRERESFSLQLFFYWLVSYISVDGHTSMHIWETLITQEVINNNIIKIRVKIACEAWKMMCDTEKSGNRVIVEGYDQHIFCKYMRLSRGKYIPKEMREGLIFTWLQICPFHRYKHWHGVVLILVLT